MKKVQIGKEGRPLSEQPTSEVLARYSFTKNVVIKLFRTDEEMKKDPRYETAFALYKTMLQTLREELIKRDALPQTKVGLKAANLAAKRL